MAKTANDVGERNLMLLAWANAEEQKDQPLIIFGGDEDVYEKLKCNLHPRACHMIKDQESLKLLQFKQKNITNDIMCMDMKYGCGVDLRFRNHGKVAIMLETEIISKYSFEQMSGRVHRDKYFPLCTVFTTTGKDTE